MNDDEFSLFFVFVDWKMGFELYINGVLRSLLRKVGQCYQYLIE